jgi:hypothetical protein
MDRASLFFPVKKPYTMENIGLALKAELEKPVCGLTGWF